MEILCRTYWYPLYAYIRRAGYQADDAQDLTQEFFAGLLEKDGLQCADASRGRFRSYLFGAMRHFLSNQRDHDRTHKRGGNRRQLPLEFDSAEHRYAMEPSHQLTPDRLFERRWALTLLDSVLNDLRAETVANGKQRTFDLLKANLTCDPDAPAYEKLAAELEMSAGAVKVAVHRFRRRYRELLRNHVAQTVLSPDEVDDEIRHLFEAVRG
jgi:RNA polymerase sigma-70 factor (ECF subfamily)